MFYSILPPARTHHSPLIRHFAFHILYILCTTCLIIIFSFWFRLFWFLFFRILSCCFFFFLWLIWYQMNSDFNYEYTQTIPCKICLENRLFVPFVIEKRVGHTDRNVCGYCTHTEYPIYQQTLNWLWISLTFPFTGSGQIQLWQFLLELLSDSSNAGKKHDCIKHHISLSLILFSSQFRPIFNDSNYLFCYHFLLIKTSKESERNARNEILKIK